MVSEESQGLLTCHACGKALPELGTLERDGKSFCSGYCLWQHAPKDGDERPLVNWDDPKREQNAVIMRCQCGVVIKPYQEVIGKDGFIYCSQECADKEALFGIKLGTGAPTVIPYSQWTGKKIRVRKKPESEFHILGGEFESGTLNEAVLQSALADASERLQDDYARKQFMEKGFDESQTDLDFAKLKAKLKAYSPEIVRDSTGKPIGVVSHSLDVYCQRCNSVLGMDFEVDSADNLYCAACWYELAPKPPTPTPKSLPVGYLSKQPDGFGFYDDHYVAAVLVFFACTGASLSLFMLTEFVGGILFALIAFAALVEALNTKGKGK